MRLVLLHVRASPTRYAALPLLLVSLLLLFNRSTYWVGIWPETGAAVGLTAFLSSALGAGVSAWAAARADHSGVREQAAAAAVVTPVLLEAARFLSSLFWLVSAYLAVSCAGFVVTARNSFPPGVWSFAGYVAMGALLVVLAAGWGWLIGRVLKPTVASVSAVLSWFVFVSVVGELSGATPISGPPWLALQWSAIGVRFLAAALFIATICAIPWRGTEQRPFWRRVSWSAASAGIVTVTLLATTVVAPRQPVTDLVCVRGAMQYCLWPEHEKYRPLVQAVDRQVAALPVDLRLPERVVDYSLSGSTRWVDGVERPRPGTFPPEFDVSEGSRWALSRGVASAIVGQVFARCEASAPADPALRLDQLQAWLEARLAGGGGPDYTTDAPGGLQEAWAAGYRAAAGLTDAEQAAWATDHIEAYTQDHCRVA